MDGVFVPRLCVDARRLNVDRSDNLEVKWLRNPRS